MSTKEQAQKDTEQETKQAQKSTYLLMQPPTDGTKFPVTRKSPSQNTQKNNSPRPPLQSLQNPQILYKPPPLKQNPNPERKTLKSFPSMPRKSSVASSVISKPSKEDLKLKNSNRRVH